jgi:hypothetical protein
MSLADACLVRMAERCSKRRVLTLDGDFRMYRKHRRRVVILKNNQVEAVIVPVDDYEKMAEALELLEHVEIYRTVTQRARKKGKKPISLEALLKEQRLAV